MNRDRDLADILYRTALLTVSKAEADYEKSIEKMWEAPYAARQEARDVADVARWVVDAAKRHYEAAAAFHYIAFMGYRAVDNPKDCEEAADEEYIAAREILQSAFARLRDAQKTLKQRLSELLEGADNYGAGAL